ncbi:MAG TPA: alpha/beta hydrolase [Acidimicrobiales bacterium]|nr:alpha/beta hydrolase [Acidimicrobiales bacterium]
MDRVSLGGVDMCYERLGALQAPTVLLIAGHGAQLQWWDDGFCDRLVAEGFGVVRFDNRDAGTTSSFESAPRPDFGAILRGEPTDLAYTLWDMADDAAGLLGALAVADAHVVGVSMGGMIAQCLAINHPERVRSLCLISSSTGAGVGTRDAQTIDELADLAREFPDPVEREVETCRRFASPGFAFDEARARARTTRHYARGEPDGGSERQLAAILATGDLSRALRSLAVPTLVIHGDADRMVTPEGGAAIAAAVPGATSVVIAGMAHELPPEIWANVVTAIVALARRADAARDRPSATTRSTRGG